MKGRVNYGKATVSWGPRTYGPHTIVANAPLGAISDLVAAVLRAQVEIDAQREEAHDA